MALVYKTAITLYGIPFSCKKLFVFRTKKCHENSSKNITFQIRIFPWFLFRQKHYYLKLTTLETQRRIAELSLHYLDIPTRDMRYL